METNKINPNVVWVITILVLTIIGLIAFIMSGRMCNAERLMDFIDPMSTILSITLSIFAIAFTYTSNNTISGEFNKINTAAGSLDVSAARMKNAEETISQNIQTVHSRLERVESAINILNQNISNVPPRSNDFGHVANQITPPQQGQQQSE